MDREEYFLGESVHMDKGSVITNFYVDGQNVFHWNKTHINVPKLAKFISDDLRGLRPNAYKYFTGVHPEPTLVRAKNLGILRNFQNQGVEIYTNELQLDEQGKYHEIGIDSLLVSQIIHDYLYNKVRGFVLLTEDRDYSPVFAILNQLDTLSGEKSRLIHAIYNEKTTPILGSEIYKVKQLENFFYDTTEIEKFTKDQYDKNKEDSLDDSILHRREIKGLTPNPSSGHSAYIVDIDSLNKSAENVLNKNIFELSVISLIRKIENMSARQGQSADIFFYNHADTDNIFKYSHGEIFAEDLRKERLIPQTISYIHDKIRNGKKYNSLGGKFEVKEDRLRGKGLLSSMMNIAIQRSIKPQIENIVIISDDPNLWPIVDVIRDMSMIAEHQLDKKPLRIVHAVPNFISFY